MSAPLTPPWQRRRSELNHDRLKNQFLPALAKWLNLLDDRLEDPAFERSFVRSVLPQWWRLRDEAVALADSCEAEMSPRRLVEAGPLRRAAAPTRAWLGPLAHALWLARYAVRGRADAVRDRAAAAQAAYARLEEGLHEHAPRCSAAGLRPLRPRFAEFRDRCRELARAIEAFPSEVKVT